MEAFKLLHHFSVSRWSLDFLLVEVFDFLNGLAFAFGFDEVEDELLVLLVLFVEVIAFINRKA
jgi:hypothetical protein